MLSWLLNVVMVVLFVVVALVEVGELVMVGNVLIYSGSVNCWVRFVCWLFWQSFFHSLC